MEHLLPTHLYITSPNTCINAIFNLMIFKTKNPKSIKILNESSTKDETSKIHKHHTHDPGLGDMPRKQQDAVTNSTQKKPQ